MRILNVGDCGNAVSVSFFFLKFNISNADYGSFACSRHEMRHDWEGVAMMGGGGEAGLHNLHCDL